MSLDTGYGHTARSENEIGTATRPTGSGNNSGPCNHCRHGDHQRCHIPYCWGCRHTWPMGSEQR